MKSLGTIWKLTILIGTSSTNGSFSSLQTVSWLVVEPTPSAKYEFVNWDYDIPNWMEKNVPNHQPDMEHPPYLGPIYV